MSRVISINLKNKRKEFNERSITHNLTRRCVRFDLLSRETFATLSTRALSVLTFDQSQAHGMVNSRLCETQSHPKTRLRDPLFSSNHSIPLILPVLSNLWLAPV